MKKLFSVLAALCFAFVAQAQIVSSNSIIVNNEKAPSNTRWILRAGMNFMKLGGDGLEGLDVKSNVGYNVTAEFQKPFITDGLYWGMNFGLSSRGAKVQEEDVTMKLVGHNVQFSPFNVGWRINVADNIAIDPHIGVYGSYDYVLNSDMDEINPDNDWDIGMNVGVGVWYKKFSLDLNYQHGFKSMYDDYDEGYGETINMACHSIIVMLRLGYEF